MKRKHSKFNFSLFFFGLFLGMSIWNFFLLKSIEKKVEVKEVPAVIVETPVQIVTQTVFTGFASYYSADGCIGCDPNQIMANGEKFDENAMTIAFNDLPLGTMVEVQNTDSGVSVIAEVTDTGGFNRLGRIADLSKGVAEKIGLKTDKTIISIKEIKND